MTTALESIVVTARPDLQRYLGRCVTSVAGPHSFAIVGLPGFRPEAALENALAQLNSRPNVTMHRLRIGSRAPDRIGADVLAALEPSLGDQAGQSLATVLSKFREAGKNLPAGRRLLVVIEDFHQFAELRKTGEQDVLDLLDCWQAACTEGQWMRVAVCSRTQPARVCANAGWSEFYKVFGIHIYRAGLLEPGWELAVRQLLAQQGLTLSDAVMLEFCQLAGGVPDFVVEMLGYLVMGPVVPGDLERMVAASTFFDERRRAMLEWLPPEARDFFEQEYWREVTPQTRQWAQECRSLGLLVERDNRVQLPTPLLAPQLLDEKPADSGTSFLHYEHRVAVDHRPLVRKLCADTYYTQLKTIQNRADEAHVLHLTRENKDGRRVPPRIIKIWKRDRLETERRNHARAQELLGASCPQLIGFEAKGAHAAMLIQYACADNRDYEVYTFEHLYRDNAIVRERPAGDSTNPPISKPVDVVERLLERVLAGLYRRAELKHLTLAGCYYPPTIKKNKDELGALSELAKTTGCLSEDDRFLVFGSEQVAEPGQFLRETSKELFESKVPTLVCDPVHGDLNVRNFLVDGAGNIHVIDFSSLREGPLLKDFVRLECEVLLKLTPVMDLPAHVGLLRGLLEADLVAAAEKIIASNTGEAVQTTLRVIVAIRRIARDYVHQANAPSDYNFEADYLGGLAATAGRVALFLDYLEKEQLAGALAYTSLASSRLLQVQGRRKLNQ